VPAVNNVGYSMPPAPALKCRVDDRDVAVRVRAIPLAAAGQDEEPAETCEPGFLGETYKKKEENANGGKDA